MMLMNDEDKNIWKDYQDACDAIMKKEKMRGFSGVEEEEAEERVEEMVELVHRIGKADREAGARRLLETLNKKQTLLRMKRWWWMSGSAAAVVVLFLAWQLLLRVGRETVIPEPVLQLTEITVPTIVYTEEDDSVVSFDSLDIEQDLFVKSEEKIFHPRSGKEIFSAEKQQKIRYNKIIIPKGYTYRVVLADGSSVTLNAGSELKYPVAFRDSLREVELKGEGFFEITKAKVPFVVKGGDSQVKVYGTRFNFFYSEEMALSEAVLLEGCIGMKAGDKEVKIIPNERVYCLTGEDMLHVEKVNAEDYTGWMGTSFKYNEARLERIIFDISRWYGVKISLVPELKNEVYTLEFDKSSDIEWVMRALELITEQNVKKEGGEYLIY